MARRGEVFLNNTGLSIIEILVVLLILTLFSLWAVPSMTAGSSVYNKNYARNQFGYDLRRARAESVRRGTRGVLSIDANGQSYSFGLDDLPYNEPVSADSTLFRRTLQTGLTIEDLANDGATLEEGEEATGSFILFDSRGYLVDESGNLQTANLSLNENGNTYCAVAILSTGQVSFACGGETVE